MSYDDLQNIPSYQLEILPIEKEDLIGKVLVLKSHASSSARQRDCLRRAVDGYGCNPGAFTYKVHVVRLTFGGKDATIKETYRRSDFKGWVTQEELEKCITWEIKAEKNLMWNILKKE